MFCFSAWRGISQAPLLLGPRACGSKRASAHLAHSNHHAVLHNDGLGNRAYGGHTSGIMPPDWILGVSRIRSDEGASSRAYPATLNDSMPAALSNTHTGAKGCVRHYRTAHCIPFLSAARRPARIALCFPCSHCSPSPGRMEEANESFT
jgi:hypothetical protein